jgi:hypothetical protein
MSLLQVLAADPFSFVTPSCGGAVDGYLQWCTQFARIAQGIYWASAQSFIVPRVQLHNPFYIAFTQHTELFSFPWRQRAAYLACLFVSSLILSLQFTYVISFSELVSILSYQTSFWVIGLTF